jgi:hypothetical protein
MDIELRLELDATLTNEWGERMARIVRRDLYNDPSSGNIDALNPEFALWRSPTELVIEFGMTGGGLIAQEGIHVYFTYQMESRLKV